MWSIPEGLGDISLATALLSQWLGADRLCWIAGFLAIMAVACIKVVRTLWQRLRRRIHAWACACLVALVGGTSARLLASHSSLRRRLWPTQQLGASRDLSGSPSASDREVLGSILANIPQGLCLFDDRYQLVVSNGRSREIYGLSEAAVQPGLYISEVLDACLAAGNYTKARRAEIEKTLVRQLRSLERLSYLDVIRDGRVISVIRTPLANGGWVTTFEDVTDQKKVEDRIEYLAHHDPLTGLSNRAAFREKLDAALAGATDKRQVALLYLDLDHFKAVNDRLGHPVGDELLQNVAVRLRRCLRETSIAARLGGDEFAVIETDLAWVDEAGRLAARIVDAISAPYQIGGEQILIGTSIGVAVAPKDGAEAEELVKSADTALYSAKFAGKNTYRYVQDSATDPACGDTQADTDSPSWLNLPDQMALSWPGKSEQGR